jgi:hypothetical protein
MPVSGSQATIAVATKRQLSKATQLLVPMPGLSLLSRQDQELFCTYRGYSHPVRCIIVIDA